MAESTAPSAEPVARTLLRPFLTPQNNDGTLKLFVDVATFSCDSVPSANNACGALVHILSGSMRGSGDLSVMAITREDRCPLSSPELKNILDNIEAIQMEVEEQKIEFCETEEDFERLISAASIGRVCVARGVPLGRFDPGEYLPEAFKPKETRQTYEFSVEGDEDKERHSEIVDFLTKANGSKGDYSAIRVAWGKLDDECKKSLQASLRLDGYGVTGRDSWTKQEYPYIKSMKPATSGPA